MAMKKRVEELGSATEQLKEYEVH